MNKSGFVIKENKKGLYGLIDDNGNIIVECVYDKILDYDDDGYIRLIKDGIYETIDLTGKTAIPHSLGITHLGVFHNGTARAKKNNKWGLIDVNGNVIVDFTFASMKAHSANGYYCTKSNGTGGYLSEDGNLTSVAKTKLKVKPKYDKVCAFHDDIAPAYDGYLRKWVFIDRDQNRVNDYEYWSMDTVLRFGAYRVSVDSKHYGYVKYNGEPLFNEWYDYAEKIVDGVGVVRKLCLDLDGKGITLNNGQPLYLYGLISTEGYYVIPPRYCELTWHDYSKHDYRIAKLWNVTFCYMPDGTRKLLNYRGELVDAAPDKPYDSTNPEPLMIPKAWQKSHLRNPLPNLPEPPKPEMEFDVEYFKKELVFWISDYGDRAKFYYRDTDADIDVKKIYKRGRIFRMGRTVEFTQKLKRPVHKTRFIIASCHMGETSILQNRRFQRALEELPEEDNVLSVHPFKEYALFANSYLAVLDIQTYAAKTQVFMVHIPEYAVPLIQKYKVKIQHIKAYTEDYTDLKQVAKENFFASFTAPVDGHSLSEEWIQTMHHPIGLDESYKPIPLEPISERNMSGKMDYTKFWLNYHMWEYDLEWREENFMKEKINY